MRCLSLLSLALIATLTLGADQNPLAKAAPAPPQFEEQWDRARKASTKDWSDKDFRTTAVKSVPVPDDFELIKLPNGKTLDTKAEFLDELTTCLQNGHFFPDGRYVVNFQNDRGSILALIAAEKGIIKGPILVFHDDGRLACAAAFTDGSQTGRLLVWNPDGERAVFGEFKLGHRNGLFCLFDNNKVALIEEFKYDKLAAAFAVKDDAVIEKSNPDGSLPFGGPVAKCSAELETSLNQITAAERKMKKALADWDEKLRRVAAAKNGLAARQAIIDRGRSENSGLIQAVRDWSKGYRLESARPFGN